jgi:hypothetical protein
MSKIKLNNNGIGRKELMLVLLIVFACLAFVLYKILGNNEVTQMANFRRLASAFADEAGRLRDAELFYEEKVYLYDTINLDYIDEMKSPFKKNELCDIYESKIEMQNRQTFLTFKCSQYYIFRQPTTENYTVFKVSEWTDEKITGDNVQTTNFYNYTIDGVEVLDKYYIEKEFLIKYQEKSGYETNFIENLSSGHELVAKTYYRTIEEVK